MKFFVTGATGFIGKALTKRLLDEKHEVVALFRDPNKTEKGSLPGLTYVKGDIMDLDSLQMGMQGCEAVFHLAAFAKLWDKDPDSWKRINITGTQNVLNAAKKAGIKKCIVTSTAGVYGPSIIGEINEKTQRAVPFLNAYEETKSISEAYAKSVATNEFAVVIVNPTRVYGPGLLSESNGVTRMAQMYVKGGYRIIPGDGKSIGNYVYIDDVVDGHMRALQYGKSGENYLLGGENADFNTFFSLLAKASGIHKRMFHLPTFLLSGAASSMELWTRLTQTPPLITKQWLKRFMYHWEVSCQKAVNDLGYTITSLETGLGKTVDWIRKNR